MVISRYVNQITCGSRYASQSSGDCIASKLSRRRPRIYRNLLHRLRFINFVFDAEACRLASAELRFLVHFFALCESLVISIKIMMEMKIKRAKS